jgi:hypothetical protein
MGAFTALAALTSKKGRALGAITIANVQAEDFEALRGQRMHFVAPAPDRANFQMQVAQVERHRPLPAEIRVPGFKLRTQPFSVFFDCNGELPVGGQGLAWIEHPGFTREEIFMVALANRTKDGRHAVYQAVFG